MRKNLIVVVCVCVLLLAVCAALAREDRAKKNMRFMREWSEEEFPVLIDSDFRALQTSAQVDTYNIIKFDMKAKGNVTLNVYNVAGQLVRVLVDEVKDAGSYTATWDGTNNNGSKVASGIYFYQMETEAFCKSRKMVLLR